MEETPPLKCLRQVAQCCIDSVCESMGCPNRGSGRSRVRKDYGGEPLVWWRVQAGLAGREDELLAAVAHELRPFKVDLNGSKRYIRVYL